ncbi:glycosyltransferase [candidate division CSSED10-310 bacterium]|uniref:Glycosyltransferase n=1 Tax=candidate division CSSED10-310 bacterium TaxID=2855610 RepID=A0ABV6YYZ7_UNCC1
MLFYARILVICLVSLGLLYWLANLVYLLVGVRKIRNFAQLKARDLEKWPSVSVIIPARNELKTLEGTFGTHLQSEYPDLEFIMVDDRSTDGTAQFLNQLAIEHKNVCTVHIQELPAGWLGKVHAMHIGQQMATGDWLLFTDADILIKPGTLTKAISLCEENRWDFLSVLPKFNQTKPVLDAVTTFIARTIFFGGQIWKAEDPTEKIPSGNGAFLLLRREVFEKSDGFPWLRMEVAVDLGVGLMMKRAGARCVIVKATENVRLNFFTSYKDLKQNIERGGFGIMGQYNIVRIVMLGILTPIIEISPWAGFLPVGLPWLKLCGLIGVIASLSISAAYASFLKRPLLSGLLAPLAVFVSSYYIVRAGIIGLINKGISWRETFYPLVHLRRGRRVKFLL